MNENDFWREKYKQLEATLAPTRDLPPVLQQQLTQTELKLLGALYAQTFVTTDMLLFLLPADGLPATVKVHIHNLRKKLAPHGLNIALHASWKGYFMGITSKERLKLMVSP